MTHTTGFNIGDCSVKPHGKKPLRSLGELSVDLNVPIRVLCASIRVKDAPKAKLITRYACWYDADEFKAWWNLKKGG
jgi:hypothetical protein